jgi:2-amino-4-hydroxy-6-hydroxymethyldihydropteridine diphosphokinase
METAFLLLGGNIGDREKIICNAISLINSNAGTVEQVSSFYETEPWGMLNAKSFLNIALKLTTKLTAFELLDELLKIEELLGRKRNQLITEYESRPIDIDILFYGSTVIQTTQLTIPHPHLQTRKFVLVPLCEIASEFIHPVLRKSIFSLLNECQDKLKTEVLKPYILL